MSVTAPYSYTGVSLSEFAKDKLEDLSKQHPDWQFKNDQRDEFPFWMSSTNDLYDPLIVPENVPELIVWLKQNPKRNIFQRDNWKECFSNHFLRAIEALKHFNNDDDTLLISERWIQALNTWSNEEFIASWDELKYILASASVELIMKISHSLSWWLKSVSSRIDHDRLFFILISKIFDAYQTEEVKISSDSVFTAINHPVGVATESALRWWFKRALQDNERLPPELHPLFSRLSDPSIEIFRHGRIALASYLITIFRVDNEWTVKHLIPLFNWKQSLTEARSMWMGFLSSSNIYFPLLAIFKESFIETAFHYDLLGDTSNSYSALLTSIALNSNDVFNNKDLVNATTNLPSKGIERIIKTLVLYLENSGDKYKEFWRNRIYPFLQLVCPKDQKVLTPKLAENFAQLFIITQELFSEVLQEFRYYLQPLPSANYILHLLNESGLCPTFPNDSLALLDLIIGNNSGFDKEELKNSLNQIQDADPQLINDSRFKRLLSLTLSS